MDRVQQGKERILQAGSVHHIVTSWSLEFEAKTMRPPLALLPANIVNIVCGYIGNGHNESKRT